MSKLKTIVKTFMQAYKDNPYSLGADRIETHEKYAVLKYSTSYERERSKQKLRNAGITAKLMSNSMQPKTHKYRYELNVWYK